MTTPLPREKPQKSRTPSQLQNSFDFLNTQPYQAMNTPITSSATLSRLISRSWRRFSLSDSSTLCRNYSISNLNRRDRIPHRTLQRPMPNAFPPRKSFSTSSTFQHGHLDKPKPGEEYESACSCLGPAG